MEPGDVLLFYHQGEFFAGGRVGRVFENSDVGELLWDNSKSRYLFTVKDFTTTVTSIETVWDILGYKGRQVVQGFTRVADDRISGLLKEYGSIKAAVFESMESNKQYVV